MASVDVLIVTALKEEFDAARAVGTTHAVAGSHWREQAHDFLAPYSMIEIGDAAGGALSLALARPTRVGGRSISPIATALTQQLQPRCLAMSGVCAGNPSVVALGDVVVAEVAYEHDEGARNRIR